MKNKKGRGKRDRGGGSALVTRGGGRGGTKKDWATYKIGKRVKGCET